MLGPVVVYMTLLVPKVILLESFLSFLGLGVQEPMTSWGVLISDGARNIQGAAYMLIFPAIFLVTTLFRAQFHRRWPARRAGPEGPVMEAGSPLLALKDVRVRFRTNDGIVEAVKGIDLSIRRNEVLAIVGESGSGKSQTMMALMGLLAANGEATGTVSFDGAAPADLSAEPLKRFRGNAITMIFQEPMTSLDPPLPDRRADLAGDPARHQAVSREEARRKAVALLELVRIPDAARRMNAYPHELSGGQRQRVMIAMALANDPKLLIADEPTTALDVTIQAGILKLLTELKQRLGMAIAFISHDLNIVRRFADRVAVMRGGVIVETGPVGEVFARPQHDYTRMLLAAEPTGRKVPPPEGAPVLLSGEDIRVTFKLGGGLLKPKAFLRAVDGVSLSVPRGAHSASSASRAPASRRWAGHSSGSCRRRGA